jgi:hypothetical protein
MADTILLTLTAEELKDLLRRGFAYGNPSVCPKKPSPNSSS